MKYMGVELNLLRRSPLIKKSSESPFFLQQPELVVMMEMNLTKRKRQSEDGFDGTTVSDLPDAILSYILSFLPTEDVAKTSFLSKRWKSLCYPLDVLDLDLDRFSKTIHPDNEKKRFTEFVERMAVLHEGRRLQELRLSIDISGFENNVTQVDKWVSFAMRSDSKALDLDFWGGKEGKEPYYYSVNDYYKYPLPQCSFPHQSVKLLRLRHCCFAPSDYMSFGSVKSVILTTVHLLGDSVYDVLVSSPCLEELHLIECIIPCEFKFHGPKSKLKYLVVDQCLGPQNGLISVEIDAPRLLRLKYVGCLVGTFSFVSPSSLIEAEFVFESEFDPNFHNEDELYHYNIMLHNLFRSINHVNTLTLSRLCLEVLISDLSTALDVLIDGHELHDFLPPPFCNLEHLTLNFMVGDYDVLYLACLLRCSPHLKTLSIHYSTNTDDLDSVDIPGIKKGAVWKHKISHCFYHLKKVEIKGFEGGITEMFFVKAMLKNALFLKEMVIYEEAMKSRYASMKRDGNKKELKLLKAKQKKTISELLSFKRGSRCARIVLS